MERKMRIVIANPWIDGLEERKPDHDAEEIALALREDGMDVIADLECRYTPEQIVELSELENADCLVVRVRQGLYCHPWFAELMPLLRAHCADDVLVIGCGFVPDSESSKLLETGVAKVFMPDSMITELSEYIKNNIGIYNQKSRKC